MKRILKWFGRIVLALVVLVVVGGAIAYWSTGRETQAFDAKARTRLGGSYAPPNDVVTRSTLMSTPSLSSSSLSCLA